uniref:Pleckstrin homology domain containing, family G (With RhoGef domain) member 4B n=1 Tax=Nothobranchius korthausae TaxID=1143690 RepID=A0A1A8EK77_9TELE
MLSPGRMHSRTTSRSCDDYLRIKDPESLDNCIQSTLSVLYCPFSATASTVLWQLFSVVERQYHGDGLHCFIDFLLPAKRILQIVQKESCVKFKGLLFYHEGWPLCIDEKVVLQLSPLHKVRLRQGDFYLQIVPLGRKAAKLVIKCLSASGKAIAEIPISESMYGSIFTAEFLHNVTCELNLHPLQNCLLTSGTAVYRTPWKNVVRPLFVCSTADTIMQAHCSAGGFWGHLGTCSTSGSTRTLEIHHSSRESLYSSGADSVFSESSSPISHMDSSSENLNINRDGPFTPTIEIERPAEECGKEPRDEDSSDLVTGSKVISFDTDVSNSGPQHNMPRDSVSFERRKLFRKSYMEALQNPMTFGSSSESIVEESPEHSMGLHERAGTLGSIPDTHTSPRQHLSCRFSSRGRLRGGESRTSTPLIYFRRGFRISGMQSERRSKSLEKTDKAGLVKAHRERSSSGGSTSISPKKLVNINALHFGKLDVEAVLPGSEWRSSKDESGQRDDSISTQTRQHKTSSEESHSPKAANGMSQSLASVQISSSDHYLSFSKWISDINQELLTSGAVILPGNKDHGGRSVLQVCTRVQVWASEACSANNLTCLLRYYHSTLRKEMRDQGMAVLIDSREQQPVPALFSSLFEFQTLEPNALYSVLFVVDKDGSAKLDRDLSVQNETFSSLKALLKHIDQTQLTRDLGGTFYYNHEHWISFRQKIEPFASSCCAAIRFLQESSSSLSTTGELKTSKEVCEALEKQKRLMKSMLDDTCLNRLRLEGGTQLARIRKEETIKNENCRDTVDMLNSLYNQVDEEVHKLVILSNKSQKQLEMLQEVLKFEEQTQQIKHWFSVAAEKQLIPLETKSLSLSKIKEMKANLDQFLEESMHQQRLGLQLMKESSESLPGCARLDFKQHLSFILSRVEERKAKLEILTSLYEFYDSASHWMEHCQKYFRQLSLDSSDESISTTADQILQDYCTEASKFSMDNFSTLKNTVLSLESPQELQQWNSVWHKCQQTKQQLEEIVARAEVDALNAAERWIVIPEHCGGNQCIPGAFEESLVQSSSASLQFPFSPDGENKLGQNSSTYDDTDSNCTIDSAFSCQLEPIYSKTMRLHKQPVKKIMKKTLSVELVPRDSSHSDVSYIHGYEGAHIKGLEVASDVSAEKKLQRADGMSSALGRSRSVSPPSRAFNRRSDGDGKQQSSKVQHIMDEMISTEREYVCSLSYVIKHYFPEMERLDLPQDLRGKQSIIYGNMEKLWDFHSQLFLKELEASANSPLSISSCFLQHEDQFGMYALYSKNKPQSDALLSSHGNKFFKNKQMELGDKMDLASYLLKPIQRMSKYALLLKDLIKECSHFQEQELRDLQTAEEMVKFQLRHGNDLLAMDAIQSCDVNLKEQGQLHCQDEFIVWCGRRKYLRHIFLFEDLILFSKTKKIEGGYDIYIYKQSFKTADIGMTENVGDSGLRFEIWFRRRKYQDTFMLQASSADAKAVWTAIIGKILWRQALIKRESPTMASIAVSSFDHCTAFKRPHSTISNSSTSYSSSQPSSSVLSLLNLHLYSSPSSPSHQYTDPFPMCRTESFIQRPYDCIEEDELEQDTTCSQSSIMTGNSETSSHFNSSESVLGWSVLTVPDQTGIIMDSYNHESSSCSSTPPSSVSSSGGALITGHTVM